MQAKFRSFRFERPSSVDEALAMFVHAGDAVYLAGGTALVTSWRNGMQEPPSTVISLARIVSRHVIPARGNLDVGAGATVADLLRSPVLGPSALRDALGGLATPQVRERATLAGNISQSAWTSALVPALLVSESAAEVRDRSGTASVQLVELLAASAPRGQLITRLAIPTAGWQRIASAADRLGPLGQGQPDLVAAVALEFAHDGAPAGARVSVSPREAGPLVFETAADGDGLRPFANRLMAEAAARFAPSGGSVARHRAHLVGVLMRRVLEQAVRRHLAGARQAGDRDGAAPRRQWAPSVTRDRAERDAARGLAGAPESHRR